MKWRWLAAPLLLMLGAAPAFAGDPLPENLLATRAQPAVFQILAIGDIEVDSPQSASADLGLLEREYAAERGRGGGGRHDQAPLADDQGGEGARAPGEGLATGLDHPCRGSEGRRAAPGGGRRRIDQAMRAGSRHSNR
jgi:hypothetical protein